MGWELEGVVMGVGLLQVMDLCGNTRVASNTVCDWVGDMAGYSLLLLLGLGFLLLLFCFPSLFTLVSFSRGLN